MTTDPLRRAQLAKIHLGAKRLNLTDELYREIIARVSGGKRSSADLDAAERARLLDELERLGFRGPASQTGAASAIPQLVRIRNLWRALGRINALQDPSDKGLRAFVKRVAHCDALEWLTAADANKIIEGLKAMLARAGEKKQSGA